MPKRGDVFLARLDPTEGSEQAETRPVVVMSRDAISQNSPVVIVVPCTDLRHKTRIYPSHVVIKAGDGGLIKDSVALGEHVRAINSARFVKQLGHLNVQTVAQLGAALKIALDL